MAKADGLEIGGRPRGARSADEANFAGHLDRKLADRQREERNVLGSGQGKARAVANEASATRAGDVQGKGGSKASQEGKESGGKNLETAQVELLALLGEYLGLIGDQARDVATGPGEWTFKIEDAAELSLLAALAGMGEKDSAALLEKFAAGGGEFEIAEFLNVFSRHFLAMEQDQPVPVPETDLPYLQMLLGKLGLDSEAVEKIGEQAVQGDNTLDLAAFLSGLEELDLEEIAKSHPEGKIVLQGWDAEQLLAVLEHAGVSRALQRELLPELHAPWDQPQRPNQPLELDLERFRQLLAQGIAEIEESRPRAEIPAFLAQLKKIFQQAGFNEQRPGWNPAVQAAAAKVYEKLLESVDLAAVRLEKVGAEQKLTLKDDLALLDKKAKIAALNKEGVARAEVRQALAEAGLVGSKDGDELVSGRLFLNEMKLEARGDERGAEILAGSADSPSDNNRLEILRALNQAPRQQAQLEQQVFNRIASGVVGGLNRNEHHLVMHLYPRELGEVRVELLVRDNQVSLNFAMENTRVKEILEKNMDMFKDNLERRGFVLGECMVSVDQQDRGSSGEAWQRFTAAWTNQNGGMVRRESLAEVPQEVLYQRLATTDRPGGIDLFA
ncbi:flagellar hook-length control protein FliK [Desulfurivibrio alkaliphilus]|uniref:Flagellar hook-length control protein n=1 Tax=Desulfurivibrio alkaliphilus (strain DSM 19089 / UNIQEM U267 / AHT2) TaxID=589865 RepID=D6Z2V5_DESAT|nr:flagellar hook-length control protein FliK [Desulfurivibrio alkaliphilus]ADH85880.1 flagellar hook-length control protein [Desulfurivibrio alkaliphilus AHT 2]